MTETNKSCTATTARLSPSTQHRTGEVTMDVHNTGQARSPWT